MNYKNILITGGAGFIGSHLTDYLIDIGHHVRVLDNLHPQIHPFGNVPSYFNPHAEFIQGDVTDKEMWRSSLQNIDVVIHFAARVGVGQSMYEIERYVRDNCLGTALFLDILANEKTAVKKMIVAASMSSFGEGLYVCPVCKKIIQPELRSLENLKKGIWEPLCDTCHVGMKAIPTPEDTKLKSPSVYAITKKTQEELVLSIGKAYRIPAVSLRFFNAYGQRQSLSNPYNGVAAIFLSRVKNNRPPIINEDGYQTRDFVHIKDIVRAIELSLKKKAADYEAFNVGSGKPVSIRHVAEVVLKLYGSSLKPEITGKFRTFDIRHCYADISKLKKLLGWEPSISFEEGLKEVFEWSKNETAIDKVDDANQELRNRGLR